VIKCAPRGNAAANGEDKMNMLGKVMIVAGVAAIVALIGGSPVRSQQQAPQFDTTKVADGVYSFRFMFHRSMFVVGSEGVIVADPINPRAAPVLLAEIKKVTAKPVKYLVYSHEHWDHVAGGQVFKAAGARIISQAKCLDAFKRNPNPDLIRVPDGTYQRRHELKVGDKSAVLHHFGPSHGNCMTIVHLPKEKIVFVVDLATPQTLPFRGMFDSDVNGWVNTLSEIEKLGATQMIPGHGPPIVPISAVSEVRGYLQDLMAAVKEAMTKTQNRDEIIKTVKLPKYEKWGQYDAWLGMNIERMVTLYANGV
jgi:glyoxylase-like metal-dependent hydrolase (beta-lactamase superfamily II)